MKLTEKQRLIYDIVVEYKERHDGNSPSLRVISAMAKSRSGLVGLSGQAINVAIDGMADVLYRDRRGQLIVVGGKWIPPEVIP